MVLQKIKRPPRKFRISANNSPAPRPYHSTGATHDPMPRRRRPLLTQQVRPVPDNNFGKHSRSEECNPSCLRTTLLLFFRKPPHADSAIVAGRKEVLVHEHQRRYGAAMAQERIQTLQRLRMPDLKGTICHMGACSRADFRRCRCKKQIFHLSHSRATLTCEGKRVPLRFALSPTALVCVCRT